MEVDKKRFGILYRLYIYLKEKFDYSPQANEEEKYAIEIAKKLTINPESHLFIAPISNKRYIKNDEKNMFIISEGPNLTIINHVYSYSVYIENPQLFSDFIDIFNKTMEEKRNQIETEIKKNIQHSLKNILEGLQN
jgi:hypothetical protein